ncbi:aminopeptidase P family protein [Sphingomonas sp. SUN019]|uniref:aminopeptidase P family protein n=1 Tax=Sphingomonas sp. SUN019 TaxID=2937788 RepID=UPI002164223B|nr:aminopeptidase P family protein [Sphingomonas sp. SUN019]UVO52164.1 aminopeptidase P family protein [Sphingomonas sp. SUN019]
MRIPMSIALAGALLLGGAAPPSQPERFDIAVPPVLPLRERAKVQDAWLAERLDTVVPRLMRGAGVDMWVLVAREYVEDPVVATMLDAESFSARRRTILMFFDPGGGRPVERMTVSRYGLGTLFKAAWKPEAEPDQWKRFAALVAERKPKKIALNISAQTALADGLTHGEYEELRGALPPEYAARIAPAGALAIGWLETRIPAEMARYPAIVRNAHAIIAEGLSDKVVVPGKTTADDVVWWFRERIAGLKLATWFQPSLHIFRQGSKEELTGDAVILPGDMLWTDFGITYLGLNTDTQHLAYVLKPGERDAPAGLRAGMAAANAVQDHLTAAFRTGRTGNQMLADARKAARAGGLEPTIYSHPIGYHGHAAGSAIGFWDNQQASPAGEHPLRADTAWSIELSAARAVPEWGGQKVQFRLEEDAYFDGRSVRYLDGRQTRFHLIGDR